MDEQEKELFFDELYEKTHQKVLAFIIAKCGNTEDISDIFQETYMEVVRVIKKRGPVYIKKPEAFVMQVAKRKIYRHYHFLERLREVENNFDFTEDVIEYVEFQEISFEEKMMNQFTIKAAFDYLVKKDVLTKKIFYLYYYMGKPIKEIADLLSVKESNVKNRLYRTLKELRKYLQNEGMIT